MEKSQKEFFRIVVPLRKSPEMFRDVQNTLLNLMLAKMHNFDPKT